MLYLTQQQAWFVLDSNALAIARSRDLSGIKFDLTNKTIELWRNKTGTESFIHMTDRVHQILQRRAENKMHERWVFTNWKRTGPRREKTTYRNDAIRKAGID